MVLKIELPDNILLSKDDEIVIKFKNSQEASHHCASHLHSTGTSLSAFVETLTSQFLTQDKIRLAETYSCTIRSFGAFRNHQEILLDEIDQEIIEEYESYLKRKGLTLNSISFYMRILRAIYNKAVDMKLVVDKSPFSHVYTKMTKTTKRAISLQAIRQIAQAEVKNQTEALARDLFLFSFYTRGMSFVDMAYLKKSDINNMYLIYKRKKTGQELKIAWRKAMQDLVDKHGSKDGIHLLGILDENAKVSLRSQYHYKQCHINTALKRLSKRLSLGVNLTMYVARHSWATIARQKNIPMGVISDGMGHNSEKTTRIYLKSIDAEIIDRSNDLLIAAVTKK